MVFCPWCQQDTQHISVVDCPANRKVGIERYWYHARPFEAAPGVRCAECGVTVGNHHHLGCSQEVCPHCESPMSVCTCSIKCREGQLAAHIQEIAITASVQYDFPEILAIANCPFCGESTVFRYLESVNSLATPQRIACQHALSYAQTGTLLRVRFRSY